MPLFSRAGYSPLPPPPVPQTQPTHTPPRSPSPTSSARLSLHTALSILPSPTSSASSSESHYLDRSLIRRPESCSPKHSPVLLQITDSGPLATHQSHSLKIEIVGTPKPYKEKKLKSDDIVSPVPSSDDVELFEDGEVFAELDACNEDPFTLERFHTLIALHAEKHKDFIIARVATKDGRSSPDGEDCSSDEKEEEGKGTEKFYYSYYTAHHINKVLFRTQPEEGLLHRMRAKNPLNNLTIVGDVHYFVVEWEHAQSVLAEHQQSNAPATNTMQSFAQASLDTFTTFMSSISSTLGVVRSAPTRRRSDPSVPVQSLTRPHERKGQPVLLQLYMQPEGLEAGFPPLTAAYDASEGVGSPRRLRSRSSGAVGVNQLAEVTLRNLQTPLSDEKLRQSLAPKESLRRRSPTKAIAGEVSDGQNLPAMEERRKSKERLRKFYGTGSKNDGTEDGVYRDLLKDDDVLVSRGSRLELHTPKASTFTAKYYASDDDFLMHASVRTYFRANALESDDAVLFTIPSSSQDHTTFPSDIETEAHPTLPAFRFARMENDPESWKLAKRKVIVGAAIVAFVLFSVLLIKFAVPHTLMVFALVIVVVVLCFMVVLLKIV